MGLSQVSHVSQVSIKGRSLPGALSAILRLSVVWLALATAAIHATLGGWMFLANAAGYTVLAVAMIAPIAFLGRFRWLVRAALIGFAVVTIVGWLMFGARFQLAYVDKVIELMLVAVLIAELHLHDGGPANVLRRSIDLGAGIGRTALSLSGRGVAR